MKYMGRFTVLRRGNAAIHSYMCPEDSEMVCSQIIETENKLVLIDAQQFIPYASELRSYMERLGKPIDRVIVTHSHPDHWMGLVGFEDLPIHSLKETRDEIAAIGEYIISLKKAQVEDISLYHVVLPQHEIKEGDLAIDGLAYRFTRIVDAEMSFMLGIELPELGAFLAQDLVYNRVFACVGEKNAKGEYLFDGWMRALRGFQEKKYEWVVPGHGEPAGPEILGEMIGYIEYAKALFESGVDDSGFKKGLMEKFPDYRDEELLDISNLFLFHRNW